MKIRRFDLEQDAQDVVNWWQNQGWHETTIHLISKNGFIIEEDGFKIAATWVITTDTPIYLMEWTIANPTINWKKRKQALEELTDYACKWANTNGASAVMVMTKSKRYIEKLKDRKFIESDTEMTHLVRSF